MYETQDSEAVQDKKRLSKLLRGHLFMCMNTDRHSSPPPPAYHYWWQPSLKPCNRPEKKEYAMRQCMVTE